MAAHTTDILIIGGGISGVAAAWELARQGRSVTLIEARSLAAMASGWTLGGVRQSGRHPAELPLARAAVARWGELGEALGVDPGYRRGGNLRLARTDAEAEVIRRLVADQAAAGLELHSLEGAEAVREIAPALSERIVAASWCPTDGHADPHAAVTAFAEAARRLGAEIREDTEAIMLIRDRDRVTGAHTVTGAIHAGCTVLAAGVHSPGLLAPLGLALPLDMQLVTVLQTAPLPPLLGQVFGVANADCAGKQEAGGRLRVTTGIGPWLRPLGGWTPEDLHPTVEEVARLGARISALLPAFRDARLARVWGGLIDLTPDGLPVLDAPAEAPGLVIAAGFSGHGFCLGPVTGEIVADLALGRPGRHPVEPFRLGRFRGPGAAAAGLTLHG